ncbi:mitogen-activated protein kinase HOG1 [Penicillium canariense]|uniref:Mitogen-activated protein kinase HOG1 n=1 Tax=Penicillium canariense TaxID=189055 RepID=A0A9W9LG34_9EURO|nr:mitogen-activated protein kinase HOG1 [Penicillium canariense]KAJ5153218.1 mitogen-activated protein kinase HOG1 [Penicillium canariense]
MRQRTVVLKKIAGPFATTNIAKRTFREIVLLKNLKHQNVRILISSSSLGTNTTDRQFGGYIYIAFRRYVRCPAIMMVSCAEPHSQLSRHGVHGDGPKDVVGSEAHRKRICSVPCLPGHAGVIHLDLAPSKLLVNRNCDLRICDFGLAQGPKLWHTGYVRAMYYKAPELLLDWEDCDGRIDVWSSGCILAELILGKPLFPGENSIHQLHAITELLGSPSEDILRNRNVRRVCTVDILVVTFPLMMGNHQTEDKHQSYSPGPSWHTRNLVHSFPRSEGKSLSAIFSGVDPLGIFVLTASAVDFLRNTLVFDDLKRATAEDTLKFPYLARYHDPADEPNAQKKLDWMFVGIDTSTDVLKAKVFAEVQGYHEEAKLQESVRLWLQMQCITAG